MITMDGRDFPIDTRRGRELILTATADDASWALMNLGQYVLGDHDGTWVRAYVYSVNALPEATTITVLVEMP